MSEEMMSTLDCFSRLDGLKEDIPENGFDNHKLSKLLGEVIEAHRKLNIELMLNYQEIKEKIYTLIEDRK